MGARRAQLAGAVLALLGPCASEELKRLRVVNGCQQEPLWVAHEAGADSGPDQQNIRIGPREHVDFLTPDGLSATRYWAKMGCDENGDHCTLGGSGGPGQKCVRRPPEVPKDDYKKCAPPIDTKFEASFGKYGMPCDPALQTPDAMDGCDYVDASLVDGFTLPFKLEIKRNDGTGCDKDWVDVIDCRRLSFALCPSKEVLTAADVTVDLKARNPKTGVVSGCYAPCQILMDSKWNNSLADGRHHSDPEVAPYCCSTPPMSPEECRVGPIERTQFLKAVHEACPGVYGYAYDDGMGLLRCDSRSTYEMTFFCPQHELSKLPPQGPTTTSPAQVLTTTLPRVVVRDGKGSGKVQTSSGPVQTGRVGWRSSDGSAVRTTSASHGAPDRSAQAAAMNEAGVDELHDCDSGLSTWQEEWSTERKEWCCANKQVGCETIEHPFDCQSSFDARHETWSFNKKDWCCAYQQLDCDDRALQSAWLQLPRLLVSERSRQVPVVGAVLCAVGLLAALAIVRQQAWPFSCRRAQMRTSSHRRPAAQSGPASESDPLDCELPRLGGLPPAAEAASPTERSSLLQR